MGGHLYSSSLSGYKEENNGKFGSSDQLVWLGCGLSRDKLDNLDLILRLLVYPFDTWKN